MPDALRLVDLTPEECDYVTACLADDLDEIPRRDDRHRALINGVMRKLAAALEITEPWHMMGTRADGAAVGRGSGPIGGCGQSAPCTPPAPEGVPSYLDPRLPYRNVVPYPEHDDDDTGDPVAGDA